MVCELGGHHMEFQEVADEVSYENKEYLLQGDKVPRYSLTIVSSEKIVRFCPRLLK